jgi:VanZ family protein
MIAAVAFIWFNSFESGKESYIKSDGIADKIKPVIDPQNKIPENYFGFLIRKTAHFTEFSLLGAVIMLLRIISKKPRVFTMLFVLLSSAVIDESIQIFTGRTDSVKDILLDFGGALTGIILTAGIYFIVSFIKRRITT